jgi:acetyl-CoA carboxylase carboxyl transferase subunit beta
MADEVRSRSAGAKSNGAHPAAKTSQVPDNFALKCPNCKELLVSKNWEKNLRVCQKCGHHFRLSATERIALLLDADSFAPLAVELTYADPLRFVNRSVSYPDYLAQYRQRSGVDESVAVGRGRIEELPVIVVVMDSHFIGGSIGSVSGERVAAGIERAAEERLPLLVVAASGGARMQEGLYALMQMAKTSAALARLAEAGSPYVSLLTDPTTGGVAASFAFLGDIILAEPGALIGFAGPRVIEQAIHSKLPKDAATAEFCLKHGMIDGIVHRRELRATLARLFRLYAGVPAVGALSGASSHPQVTHPQARSPQ